MENNYNLPKDIIDGNINAAVKKTALPIPKMILLGLLAGMFIAFGGAGSSVAVHAIDNVSIARIVSGIVFPTGLILVVLLGAELFTGNCLITMAVFNKKVSFNLLLRNLAIVYCSNFVGSLIIAFFISYSGQWNVSNGGLGAYTIKVALTKSTLSPGTSFISGILCNILVCLAILGAAAAKDITGKILAIFFPIWVFVISGFEHCVANMYFIPAGILAAKNPVYLEKANELYGITADAASSLSVGGLFHNLIPVTLGNIVGGVLFVGVICFYIHEHDWNRKSS